MQFAELAICARCAVDAAVMHAVNQDSDLKRIYRLKFSRAFRSFPTLQSSNGWERQESSAPFCCNVAQTSVSDAV